MRDSIFDTPKQPNGITSPDMKIARDLLIQLSLAAERFLDMSRDEWSGVLSPPEDWDNAAEELELAIREADEWSQPGKRTDRECKDGACRL